MLPPSTSTPTLPPSLSQMDFNQSNNQQQEMQQQYPPYSHPSPSTSTLPPPLTSSTSTPNLGSPLTLSNTSSLPPTVTSPSSYLYYPPLPSPRHHPYIKPPLLLHTHSDLGQLPTTNTTSPTNLTPTSDPSSANPFAFSSPSAPSPPVRNHSAPGHILTLSSVLQSQIGETVSTGGGQHPLSNIETIPSQPLSTPTLDWSMSNPPNPSSSEDSYFQQPVFSSPISAISLVRNRLPILEAALVGSAKDVGNDEDEIWKGVEGAFEELKRVMSGRREVRRVLAGGGGGVQAGKGAKVCFFFSPFPLFSISDLTLNQKTENIRDNGFIIINFLADIINPLRFIPHNVPIRKPRNCESSSSSPRFSIRVTKSACGRESRRGIEREGIDFGSGSGWCFFSFGFAGREVADFFFWGGGGGSRRNNNMS